MPFSGDPETAAGDLPTPDNEPSEVAGAAPEHRRPPRTARERRERIARFGGTANTENAVEAGLAWLAAHQSPDGRWDRFTFERNCPSDEKCGGVAIRRTQQELHAGMTGLVLLAFLGAGYTDRDGPYQDQVGRGIELLLSLQRPDGGFSPQPEMAGYNNSVATFALAEYYALTEDPRAAEPLARAVQKLAAMQQELGGWDYLPSPSSGRNDTSITGWAVQALRAAAAAGVPPPRDTLVKAALHLARSTEPDGRVWYADAGVGFDVDQDMQPDYRYGPAMTAVGLTCAPLLGLRRDAPIVRQQQALLLADAPSQALARGKDAAQLHSEYYWYYGTVAMFQEGGDEWDRWNSRLRDVLLPLQDRRRSSGERRRHSFGSWQPYAQGWGKWGRMGSRVYTTAICTLTLEIYYRHTPAYLEDECVIVADDWRKFLAGAGLRDKRNAIRILRDSRYEIGEGVLLSLLNDPQAEAALAAAIALADIDSPLGAGVVARALPELRGLDRSAALAAQQRIAALAALDKATGRVRFFDASRGLGTAELARAFAGMELLVLRQGRRIGAVRVGERYTDKQVVLIEARGGEPPRNGDELLQE